MTQPVRLGLPWQLNHYKPLNGAHPLVLSFLEGNGAVEPVAITPVAATVPRETQTRVIARLARQTNHVPDALLPTFIDWLSLPDQVAIESQSAACDALFLHTAPLHAASAPWIFHFESFPACSCRSCSPVGRAASSCARRAGSARSATSWPPATANASSATCAAAWRS